MQQRTKAILSGISLAIFSILMIGLMLWLFSLQLESQLEAIYSGRQLIVISGSDAYAPGIVVFLVVLLLFSIRSTFYLIRSKQPSVKGQRFVKAFSTAMLVSFAFVFIFNYLINSYFESKVAEKGYQPCPATTLLFTRVTYSAWTLNPALCYDADVKRIVQRGGWSESKEVEQMLQQRQRQQEARRQFLLQEEKIKQQRAQRAAEAEQN